MNVIALTKKLATRELSITEQVAFVHSINTCLSSLALLLQKSRVSHQDMKKTDAALRIIHSNH